MREQALLSFTDTLNISRSLIVQREQPDSLYLEHVVNISEIKHLTPSQLKDLQEAFGEALEVEIGVSQDFPDIELKHNTDISDQTNNIQELAESSPEGTRTLYLTFNKQRIWDKLGEFQSIDQRYYFLFKEALNRFLDRETTSLCETLFPNVDLPVVIVVAESDVNITGKRLSMYGENAKNQFRGIQQIDEPILDRDRVLRKLAQDNVKWVGFQFPTITPFHLEIDRHVEPRSQLQRLLLRHFVDLFVIYTANLVVLSAEALEITYISAGGEQFARFIVKGDIDLAEENHEAMLGALDWLVEQNGQERLRYLQTVIARDTETDQDFLSFLGQVAEHFQNAVHSNLAAIDGKIVKNLDNLQAITRYVSQTNSEIGKAIDNLTKSLNDALVGAIGVVILGLITALSGGKTTGIIFTVLMIVYALYIVLFQVFFRLPIIKHGYDLLARSADVELKEYRTKIRKDKHHQLTGTLDQYKKQFEDSFHSTRIIFWGLTLVLLVVGILGPSTFLDQNLVSNSQGLVATTTSNSIIVTTVTPVSTPTDVSTPPVSVTP